ncbi:MAG: arginase [Clostridia bacterium]|nr:arginase [Clostridia bacterium]
MEGLNLNIVIMNFSGIYEEELFYQNEEVFWLDLKDISGTNCYCDEEAVDQILERLEKCPGSGIYFIDSGNYHYMSRIGAQRVKEPFNLLVFDNHTDMQLPAFGGLLSCGGWIASALEEVENLKEVWLIGPDEEAYSQVEEPFKDRVRFLSREELSQMRMYHGIIQDDEKTGINGKVQKNIEIQDKKIRNWIQEIPAEIPLYVSIDKDVLCKENASTTWSQGDMTLEELLEMLTDFTTEFWKKGGRILQVDICGECDPDESVENNKNDHANRELLKFWKGCFERGILL